MDGDSEVGDADRGWLLLHLFLYARDGISYYKRLKEVEEDDVMSQTAATYSAKQTGGKKNILKKNIRHYMYVELLIKRPSYTTL